MRKFLCIFTLTILLLSPGCFTSWSILEGLDKHRAPKIYGGSRLWLECLTSDDAGGLIAFYFFPDLPVSILFDTALLPVTVTANLVERLCSYGPLKHSKN